MSMIDKDRNATVAEPVRQPSSIRWALISLALSMLLSSLGISIPNVALPTLTQAFSASFQDVQWVILSYLLAITIMIVSVGRLGDILGHRSVLLAGIFLFTVASVLCAVAPTLLVLVIARALQGIGAAILMALTMALVRETVPKEKTGSAMGLIGTMSAIGTALGPSLGGILLEGPGWRAIFLIMVPLGVVNLLLAARFLPAQKRTAKIDRNSFDILGTLLLGFTLGAYTLAMTAGHGHFGQLNMALLLAAAAGAILFVSAESRVTSPLIQLVAFRDRTFNASLAMNLLVSTVMMATLVVGPFYLARALGLRETAVGLVMSVGPIISTLSGVVAGRIVDRLGAPLMVIVGLIEMAAGALALSVLPQFFGIAGFISAIVILTPGYQLFQAANNTVVMADVSANQRGVISGMLSLSRNLGLITGASVMGALFAYGAMTTDITTASPSSVATGMQITFAVASALIVAALVIRILTPPIAADVSPERTN